MGFFLFLLVTATLLIRPAEQSAELAGAHLYEAAIVLCLIFSLGAIVDQFRLHPWETRPISICIGALLGAVVLSHLSQGNALGAADNGFEFLKILIYYILLVSNLTTTLRLRIFLVCLGLSAVAFVTLAVLQYHEVIQLPEPVVTTMERSKGSEATKGAFVTDKQYDAEAGQMVEFRRLRGTGIFRDPNDLSLLLTMGFFIAIYGLTDRQQAVFRLLWLGPVALFVYALWLTQSRGGFVSLLAGCMALLYTRFGWRGLLLLGLPLFPLAAVAFGGRMASFSASEGTGQTRIQIWSDSIAVLMSAPVFGVGLNELATEVGKVAHNSFLGAYAELGLFGGTLFLGTFFFAAVALQRLLHGRNYLADGGLRHLIPTLTAVLVSYGTGIMFLSRVDSVPTYLVLGLVAAMANIGASYVPMLAPRLNGRLLQQLALASIGFLAASYVFVRVLKV